MTGSDPALRLKGTVGPGGLGFELPMPPDPSAWPHVQAFADTHLLYLSVYLSKTDPPYLVAFPLAPVATLLRSLPLSQPLVLRWHYPGGANTGWLPQRCTRALRQELRSSPAALDLFTASEIEEAWSRFFHGAPHPPAGAVAVCPNDPPVPLDLPLPF
ncbi:hypothetical protein [Oceanithermus sp.]|uniref:hypothetical protein n=1 Tax=Oceanithermus sp. TaxID=2268145 RepID=UPI0025805ED7|nr:hypothetical protein [Oceanithermus sp.]